MKDPCKTCVNYSQQEFGIRTFIGCKDDKKRSGFNYDHYWYKHTCSNHELRKECAECKLFSNPYCESIYAISKDGKCEMGVQIL